MNGQQGGDPRKLAEALVTLSDSDELPLRFVAGADAMGGVEQNLATIGSRSTPNRDLSGPRLRGDNQHRNTNTAMRRDVEPDRIPT